MQLREECTSHHISNLISFFPLNLSSHHLIYLFPNTAIKCQHNRVFFAFYGWMLVSQKSILEDNVILFTWDDSFSFLILNNSDVYDAHKLWNLVLIMNDISSFVVLCFKIVKNYFNNLAWNTVQDVNILQKKRNEVFLIWLSFALFAYLRNRHQLFLIIFVHEISKSFLISQPFRKLSSILCLPEINSFCILISIDLSCIFVLERDRMQLPVIRKMSPFDLVIDNSEKVESLMHLLYLLT